MSKIKKNLLGFTTTMLASCGFTLIELLVVIAIIGILTALGFYGFSTAQKKARDVQRKNDLKEVKQALEAYAGAHNGLYATGDGASKTATSEGTGIFGTATTDPLDAYLPDPSAIDDPLNSATNWFYQYNGQSSGGDAYVLSAKLEGESGTAFWVVCSNGVTGIDDARPSSATCPL